MAGIQLLKPSFAFWHISRKPDQKQGSWELEPSISVWYVGIPTAAEPAVPGCLPLDEDVLLLLGVFISCLGCGSPRVGLTQHKAESAQRGGPLCVSPSWVGLIGRHEAAEALTRGWKSCRILVRCYSVAAVNGKTGLSSGLVTQKFVISQPSILVKAQIRAVYDPELQRQHLTVALRVSPSFHNSAEHFACANFIYSLQ